MAKNSIKQVAAQADNMKSTYGFTRVEVDTDHKHPVMYAWTATDIVICCNGLPNTSDTPSKMVAQNALKRMRAALKLNLNSVAYGGGKK